jgi:hypothetical protein
MLFLVPTAVLPDSAAMQAEYMYLPMVDIPLIAHSQCSRVASIALAAGPG